VSGLKQTQMKAPPLSRPAHIRPNCWHFWFSSFFEPIRTGRRCFKATHLTSWERTT